MRVINTERIPIKLWLDNIEEGALAQARDLANLPFPYKWISIMPDCHEGYGMPIGGVMAAEDMIVPNAVGVDIGCGMMALRTNAQGIEVDIIKSIMGGIRKVVPVGFSHHRDVQKWDGFDRAPNIPIIQEQLLAAQKQLGTLGGGNHFIEIQKGDDGFIWIMLHSGSRNFGLRVAEDYHKKAVQACERWYSNISTKDLSFLPFESLHGKEYFEAMIYCVEFALANRTLMMDRIKDVLNDNGISFGSNSINIPHNYASIEEHYGKEVIVHRKGATKATKGLIGIIPGSMGTSSYIVQGLGNPESFMSCSHGAGRAMGRGQAKRELNLADEQKKMDGIIHGLRTERELDEAPGAYKDIDVVMDNQKDLVEIVTKLTPLGVIKG